MPYSSEVTPGTNGTADQFNKLRKDFMLGAKQANSHAYAASIDIDMSDATKGNLRNIALEGDVTITLSGLSDPDNKFPKVLFLQFTQDASGAHQVTMPSGGDFPGGSFQQPSQGANETTGYLLIIDSATTYKCYYAGFGLS